jgi:hypothetical protein
MPRARQNTNGGIEAYHLTLKRCIDRWLGEMQGRRMDGLVHLLFEKMLSFFMYSMYLKRKGLVAVGTHFSPERRFGTEKHPRGRSPMEDVSHGK